MFDRPLTIQQMQRDRELRSMWGTLRANMQPPSGKPPLVSAKVLDRLEVHLPALQDLRQRVGGHAGN